MEPLKEFGYHEAMQTIPPVGDLIRHWRTQRRYSQLELSIEAEISSRHLSFIETGRSHPSREMILRLAEPLEIPLRERNILLESAGYAAQYHQSDFTSPELAPAREMVERILQGHEPYPALTIDRHKNLVAANQAATKLVSLATPALLTPPVNVVRLSLHPEGLAPYILNLEEWRDHVVARLRREAVLTGDPFLRELIEEAGGSDRRKESPLPQLAIPFRIMLDGQELSFLSTTTVFGTATEVTLSELTLETFFPADAATARILKS